MIKSLFLSVAVFSLLTGSAIAGPIFSVSTGTANNPWQVGGNPAVDITSPPIPWVVAPVGSGWIGASSNNGTMPVGSYRFTLDLTGKITSGVLALISYSIAADDSFAVSFSGNITCGGAGCSTSAAGPGAYDPLVGPNDAFLTWNGVGTPLMTVDVGNAGSVDNPMGLLISGTVTDADVPEPGTWSLLAGSLGLLAWARRRK